MQNMMEQNRSLFADLDDFIFGNQTQIVSER